MLYSGNEILSIHFCLVFCLYGKQVLTGRVKIITACQIIGCILLKEIFQLHCNCLCVFVSSLHPVTHFDDNTSCLIYC